jgi:hypothetical protein
MHAFWYGLWLDIRTRVLMGQDLEQPRKFAARQLKCDNPRVRNKYYEHYIDKKQLHERIHRLAVDGKGMGVTQQHVHQYGQLDALQKRSLRSTATVQEIPYRRKILVTKYHNTGIQSTLL